MFSFFKRRKPADAQAAEGPPASDEAWPPPPSPPPPPATSRDSSPLPWAAPAPPVDAPLPSTGEPPSMAATVDDDRPWLARLRQGLRKTGANLTRAFTGAQIDDALYDELETALLMADAGLPATAWLLAETRWRVREYRAETPDEVRRHLAAALADLLRILEAPLYVGDHQPTVMMVVGVNGAGKTTTIGKLTRHLAEGGERVLLAAADTFRAAAKEQLAVWAGRNQVDIVSHSGADPASVAYDAVAAGAARGRDVVIADTAGRLPTQLHLMDELKKIKRTIGKAQDGAPHEVLLVVDGNTGQNALAQVKAFDEALGLTGLVITKLDGTAKGGVLAAIARWNEERRDAWPVQATVPVYFVGVGEQLEDLQPFDAQAFAEALVGVESGSAARADR